MPKPYVQIIGPNHIPKAYAQIIRPNHTPKPYAQIIRSEHTPKPYKQTIHPNHTLKTYAQAIRPNHTPKPYAQIITTVVRWSYCVQSSYSEMVRLKKECIYSNKSSIKGNYAKLDVTQRVELAVCLCKSEKRLPRPPHHMGTTPWSNRKQEE